MASISFEDSDSDFVSPSTTKARRKRRVVSSDESDSDGPVRPKQSKRTSINNIESSSEGDLLDDEASERMVTRRTRSAKQPKRTKKVVLEGWATNTYFY